MTECSEQNLGILTKRQREVYLLRQQKLTFRKIAEQLGGRPSAGRTAYQLALRRLREQQAKLLQAELEQQPADFPVTLGELDLICKGRLLLYRDTYRRVGVKPSDGNALPPQVEQVLDLLLRAHQTHFNAAPPVILRKSTK